MCRVLYSTPTDRARDVSLARFPFNSRADNTSSARATRGYQNGDPKGTVGLAIILAIFTLLSIVA